MKISDILGHIDSFAPFSTAAEWDNSGLLIGDAQARCSKVVICLDVTTDVINFAKKENAELIISHHPVIFKPQSSFLCGNCAYEAAKNNISIICAHTNLDKASGGVNDTLCEILGLEFSKESQDVAEGFLNTVVFNEGITTKELSALLRDKLGGAVSYSDAGAVIHKAAICSGAGADFLNETKTLGCDALITGEASYHEFLEASAMGISLFAAGHFETEVIIVRKLAEKLRNEFTSAEFFEFVPENSVITEK